MKKWIVILAAGSAMLVGIALNRSASTAVAATSAATQPATVDLMNTVCPVTGEKVGDSKLTEVYNGKIYHFCCDDCPKEFKANPDKFAQAVAADPAKYGVKH